MPTYLDSFSDLFVSIHKPRRQLGGRGAPGVSQINTLLHKSYLESVQEGYKMPTPRDLWAAHCPGAAKN